MIIRMVKEKDAKKIAAIMIDSWQKNFKDIVPEEVLYGMDPVKISKKFQRS